ncbi:CoA transferase [Actinomadura sp. WMMB 499]|uniref:CoA transferase n=1 Tax=Actinomadura sp. WMMB 499 TaxID=1219491 RepID=UPI0020C82C37|nr:CoA transferase [Actinomadura sp. WMMB 499]
MDVTSAAYPLAGTVVRASGDSLPLRVAAARLRALGCTIERGGPAPADAPAGRLAAVRTPFPGAPPECAIGWSGPVRVPLRGEHDVQAACGIMQVHGRATGGPRVLPVDFASVCAGVLAAQAFTAGAFAALHGRTDVAATTSVARAAALALTQYVAVATAEPGADRPAAPPPGGGGRTPPFRSSDGTRFEIETFDAERWHGFWTALGAGRAAIVHGWPPFQQRFATATCALPPELGRVAGGHEYRTVRAAADAAGVSIVPLRDAAAPPPPAPPGSPWRLAPIPASAGPSRPASPRSAPGRPASRPGTPSSAPGSPPAPGVPSRPDVPGSAPGSPPAPGVPLRPDVPGSAPGSLPASGVPWSPDVPRSAPGRPTSRLGPPRSAPGSPPVPGVPFSAAGAATASGFPAGSGVPTAGPLAGMRVVESTNRVQGPLAGHLLGLLGAEVVRLEPPGGDPLRGVPPMAGGGACSARFLALNRGKAAVEADLKSAAGREAALRLAASADVFLQNWPPGRAARFGLDAADLPALVYAHAGGWADALPEPQPMGTDYLVQAHSGVAALVDGPTLMTVTDVLGALIAAEGTVAGLLARARTGAGVSVGTALIDAARLLRAAVHSPVDDGGPRAPVVSDLAAMATDPAFADLFESDGTASYSRAPWTFDRTRELT